MLQAIFDSDKSVTIMMNWSLIKSNKNYFMFPVRIFLLCTITMYAWYGQWNKQRYECFCRKEIERICEFYHSYPVAFNTNAVTMKTFIQQNCASNYNFLSNIYLTDVRNHLQHFSSGQCNSRITRRWIESRILEATECELRSILCHVLYRVLNADDRTHNAHTQKTLCRLWRVTTEQWPLLLHPQSQYLPISL